MRNGSTSASSPLFSSSHLTTMSTVGQVRTRLIPHTLANARDSQVITCQAGSSPSPLPLPLSPLTAYPCSRRLGSWQAPLPRDYHR
jgi:hypothetical protein